MPSGEVCIGAIVADWIWLPPTKEGNIASGAMFAKPGSERKTPKRFWICSTSLSCRSRTSSGKKVSCRMCLRARIGEEQRVVGPEVGPTRGGAEEEPVRRRQIQAGEAHLGEGSRRGQQET